MNPSAVAAKAWFDIALDDLDSATNLYVAGKYRNSYYHFQQASEKAIKASGLLLNAINQIDLGKIGHNSIKVYSSILEQQKLQAEDLLPVLQSYPKVTSHKFFIETGLGNYPDKLQAGLDLFKEMPGHNAANLTLADLDYLQNILMDLGQVKWQAGETEFLLFKEAFSKFIDWITEFETHEAKLALETFPTTEDEMREFFYTLKNDFFPLLLDSICISTTLMICSLITSQQNSKTRYPDNGISPLETYIADLPIIKKQPDFMDFLRVALAKINVLYYD